MGIVRARDDSCNNATVCRGRPLTGSDEGQIRAVEHEMEARAGRDHSQRRCCMKTRCGWGGLARPFRDASQEPHYRDAVEGSSPV